MTGWNELDSGTIETARKCCPYPPFGGRNTNDSISPSRTFLAISTASTEKHSHILDTYTCMQLEGELPAPQLYMFRHVGYSSSPSIINLIAPKLLVSSIIDANNYCSSRAHAAMK